MMVSNMSNMERVPRTGATWDEDIMDKALSDVVTGKMGYKMAARMYAIPRSTLQRRVTKYKESGNAFVQRAKGNFKRVFTEEQESEIVQKIKEMQQQMKRIKHISKKDMREIAYFYAVENKVKHPFDFNSKMAGEDWLRGFLNRHPDVVEVKATTTYPIPIFNKHLAPKLYPIKPISNAVKEVCDNNIRKYMLGKDVEVKVVNSKSSSKEPPKKMPKLDRVKISQPTQNFDYMQYPDIDYDQFFHFMSHYRQ